MKEVYLGLMEEGWALSDIDEMDFFYYLDIRIYKANKDNKVITIDQIF